MDIVASLYQRNNLHDILSLVANNIFVPITAGGGVKSIKDAQTLLRAGADKIAINTEAVKNPKIITELAENIGSQAVVLSIEAKKLVIKIGVLILIMAVSKQIAQFWSGFKRQNS